MYGFLLGFHNFFRWVVLLLAAFALVRTYSGWLGKRSWMPADRNAGLFFRIGMDIQFLIGLLLYFFFSPITRAAFANFRAAMGSRELAFFVIEHGVTMLIAVILVHVGSAFSRRANGDNAKHRSAAVFFSLAALAVLIAIPWWRPLLRF